MNMYPGRHGFQVRVGLRNKPQMQLILLTGEASSELGNYLLSPATTKMWD